MTLIFFFLRLKMRHTLQTLQFRSCNRFPHNKTVSTVPALFITRVNNSAEYQCHWSNPSVCDLQLVCCRGKLRQVFPGTAAELEPCTTLQRALRIQSPLHQLDKEKPITYCYAALGKKCGDLLHFFTAEEKKKKSIPWGMRGGGRFVSVLILWLMSKDLAI